MRLHLGCGKKRLDGYLNCDLHDSDLDMDIRRLPFGDNEADEILAIHVVEHFYVCEVLAILKDWYRVLKPGGAMILELPCLDKVLWHFANGSPEIFTTYALYGAPGTHKDKEPAMHKWCYTRERFNALLKDVGFDDIDEQKPHYHQATRDMRWVCIK